MHDIQGLHHLHRRKRSYMKHDPYPHPEKWKRILDRVVVIAGVIGPIMTIPQVWKIWVEHQAAGVSAVSWFSYMLCAVVWLVYGFAHKEKPIIITYAFWILMDAFIVIGTLLYG